VKATQSVFTGRKRIEAIFGWGKTTGGLHQLKVRGIETVTTTSTLALTAYNTVGFPKLLAAAADVCPHSTRPA
jgi:hypothetical protein